MIGPRVTVSGRSWSAFRALGVTGFTFAVATALAVGAQHGLSPVLTLALVALSVAVFFGLALVTKALTGEEQLIYLHHQIAILGACAVVTALLGEPVLASLDTIILGMGAFLVCGRLGCLLTGCCHGRPAEHGVCYRGAHVDTGVAPYLVGRPLVPVQALESAWVFLIVALGLAMVFADAAPGAALGAYVVAYGAGRSALERLRGDAGRHHAGALSEAEWLSLTLAAAVVAGWVLGGLPLPRWPVAWALLLVVGMAGLAAATRAWWRPTHPLLHPRHAREVLATRAGAGRVRVRETRAGVRVSRGEAHFSFSARRGRLSEAEVRDLAALVGGDAVAGVAGVVHVLTRNSPASPPPEVAP